MYLGLWCGTGFQPVIAPARCRCHTILRWALRLGKKMARRDTIEASADRRGGSPSASSTNLDAAVFVHPLALCESERVGAGTRVWAFAHVMSGARLGKDCNIGDHAFIESGAILGDGVVVKNGAMIWDGVTIEDAAFIGPAVVFTNDRFPRSRRSPVAARRYARAENWREDTLVRRGASIGARAVILCGITVGEYACVAAGAVVTRDVSDHALVAGHPARAIGWVCACGHRLSKTLLCEACNRSHVLEGERLSIVE